MLRRPDPRAQRRDDLVELRVAVRRAVAIDLAQAEQPMLRRDHRDLIFAPRRARRLRPFPTRLACDPQLQPIDRLPGVARIAKPLHARALRLSPAAGDTPPLARCSAPTPD